MVGVTHYEHLRQVHVLVSFDPHDFGFYETDARIAPACTGTVLVLDGGDRVLFHGSEHILRFFLFIVLVLGKCLERRQYHSYGRCKNEFVRVHVLYEFGL